MDTSTSSSSNSSKFEEKNSVLIAQANVPPAKDRAEKHSGLCRVFNPPKLEKKHSSGDLISRLKTRKILGVGETDNGDIHRSKISQVLGHNEHLYVKLPGGYWLTHILLTIEVTLEALIFLFAPSIAFHVGLLPHSHANENYPFNVLRITGAALSAMSVFLWALVGTRDKHYARTVLASIFTYHILCSIIFIGNALGQEGLLWKRWIQIGIGVRTLFCLVCILYIYRIGEPGSGVRKSTSYREIDKDDSKSEAKQTNRVSSDSSSETEDKKEK